MKSNNKVKAYYRDCGKGLRENDPRILWGRVRGFPSYLYQSQRIEDTKAFLKKFKLKGQVLDAACGSGYILSILSKGSVGIDINPRHVVQARILAPQARVFQADIEKMPFGKESFDVVLATEIFEHIPDPGPAISEMWRVLKRGGVLVVSVPKANFLWKVRFLASSMYSSEPQCVTFSRESILQLFKKYDYDIKHFQKIAWGLNYLLVLKKHR